MKFLMLNLICFILLPYSIKAQYTVQDSIADAKQYEKNVRDTKQKIIGTWYYKNTILHGTQTENDIDSNRVYIFTKKRVTIISKIDGKIIKKNLKYNILAESGAIAYLEIIAKQTKSCSEGLAMVIESISDNSMTFSACYNDHCHVTFTKIK